MKTKVCIALLLLLCTLGKAAWEMDNALILFEGPKYLVQDIIPILQGSELRAKSLRTDAKRFRLPRLFRNGNPVYSHIVIVGSGKHLKSAEIDTLIEYINTPSNLEHEVRISSPSPGASLMVLTDGNASPSLIKLLKGVGVTTTVGGTATDIYKKDIIYHKHSGSFFPTDRIFQQDKPLAVQEHKRELLVKPNFSGEANGYLPLVSREGGDLLSFWSGAETSIRMVFCGSMSAFLDSNDEDILPVTGLLTFKYMAEWFAFRSQHVRVASASVTLLEGLGGATTIAGRDSFTQGDLVRYDLSVEQLFGRVWRPWTAAAPALEGPGGEGLFADLNEEEAAEARARFERDHYTDLQLTLTRGTVALRENLRPDPENPGHYIADIRLPDQLCGIYKFKVDHTRPALTRLRHETLVPVVPPRNTQGIVWTRSSIPHYTTLICGTLLVITSLLVMLFPKTKKEVTVDQK
eukprot:gnl/Dysnectes_brevis/874_a969_2854.p1 GENE.gnl/Dysnectes_brevis/874_a969_2854~~gnl/Dysnectes_brevis/874_a969_2854.p1  ORF type:complete len:480 (+),score=81.29 gnl/Dysnectes_brevis/874_a969_2854:53-1441(+)